MQQATVTIGIPGNGVRLTLSDGVVRNLSRLRLQLAEEGKTFMLCVDDLGSGRYSEIVVGPNTPFTAEFTQRATDVSDDDLNAQFVKMEKSVYDLDRLGLQVPPVDDAFGAARLVGDHDESGPVTFDW